MSKHEQQAKYWLNDASAEYRKGNAKRADLCVGRAQAEALIYAADALRILRKYMVSGYEYEKWLRNRANEIEKEVLGYEE